MRAIQNCPSRYADAALGESISYNGHYVLRPSTSAKLLQQRYYDPVAGRFLSTDQVITDSNSSKSFNRYTYANNNPFKYIDPDGREYRIVGSPEFVKRVEADIKAIESGKNGAVAINELRTSEKMISITQSTDGKNQTEPNSFIKAHLGLKTNSTISYNPDKTKGPVDEKGGTSRPAFVGLAHEIGHANGFVSGTQSMDVGEKKLGTTPPAEINSLKTENGVRADHGIPSRPAYYDKNNSNQ